MTITAIINPRSGGRRSPRNALRLADKLRAAGVDNITLTEYPCHGEHLARDADAQTVIAVGGDGIVHEVVNGLMARPPAQRPQFAVVPVGSGNDFAYACDLPRDIDAAIERAVRGEAKPVDIANIQDGAGRTRWFANSAGMLFDGAINMHSHRMPCGGFAKYALATAVAMARSYKPNSITLTLDEKSETQPLTMLTISNGPREGGKFYCTPDARNDDGLLDLLTATPLSRGAMLRLLPKVMKAAHVNHPAIRISTARRVTINAADPIPIHLDGELWAKPDDDVRQLTITLETAALDVRR